MAHPGPNGKKNPYSNFATHEPLFRQGHVGDLEGKSRIEIVELLERQEKLLANRYDFAAVFYCIIGL